MDDFRILRQLRGYRGRLRRSAVLSAMVVGAFLFAVPMVAGGVWDRMAPWREETCFKFVVGFGCVALVTVLVRALMAFRQPFDVGSLARKVETNRPELMNGLSCAVELIEGRGPDHPLHHALLADLDDKLSTEDLYESMNRGRMRGLVLLALLMVAFALMVTAHFMPLGYKARARALDVIKGEQTGLTVLPGSKDIPEMADVRVQATVNRGPTDGVWITLIDGEQVQRFQMTNVGGKRFEFEIFGVSETMDYEVSTPTLASDRHRLRVFKRPEFNDVEIRVAPPKYTRLETTTHTGFQSLSVPQNATVTIVGHPVVTTSATLVVGDRAIPFDKNGETLKASITPSEDTDYRVRLEDEDGHMVELGPWALATVDDMPPLIKVLVPAKETISVQPSASTPIVAECSDDYGIASVRVRFNRNGLGWTERNLLTEKTPGQLSATMVETLSIKDGEIGDVFVYYLEATDFAEPTPNISRSGVRFIEIRPKPPEPKDAKNGGGGKPPDDSLTVADLIMRTKALIRETFALDFVQPDQRDHALLNLTGSSADLALDATRRYRKLKEKADADGLSLGPLGELFELAVTDLDTAYKLMGKSLPVEASGRHQSALAALIRLEVELKKQAQKSKGKGKGKPSEDTSKSPPKTDKERKEAQENQRKKLDQVTKTLAQIDELLAREAGIRRTMGQLADVPAPTRKNQVAHAGRKQRDVAEATGRLADDVSKTLTEAPDLTLDLKRALMRMQEAGRQMDANAPGDAKNNAQRAEAFLKRAKATAEALRRNLSGSGMDAAIANLDKMITRQAKLAADARDQAAKGNPSRDEARQASGRQGTLKDEFDALLSKLSEAADELDERSPGAGAAMERILATTENDRIGGNMKRATNALKYAKPGRAAGFQETARTGMESMANSLKALRKQLGKATAEQLAAMLEGMMKNLQGLEQNKQGKLSDGQRAQLAEKLGKDVKDASDMVDNPALDQLSKEIRKHIGAGGRLPPEMSGLAAQFCEVLEKELFQALMKRKMNRAGVRDGGVPESYRNLVEDYFKALAEDRDVEEE